MPKGSPTAREARLVADPVVVVGGGITGLAAAHQLQESGEDFVLLEASPRIGGRIDGGRVGPLDIDSAADGFLARQPEMADLCVEIGLGDQLVRPSGKRAFIWADGALRPIPAPSVLGVPLDPDAVSVSGIVSEAGVQDLRSGLAATHPPLVADSTVGAALRPVVGGEVFERLVDPLLGGINAGSADRMSIMAGAPQLAAAAAIGGDMLAHLSKQAGESAKSPGPVFLGVEGGTQRIIERLALRLAPHLGLATPALGLRRAQRGWIVDTPDGGVTASRVILTSPASISADLVAPFCPESAALLRGLAYSSAVLVTFVIDRTQISNPLDGSGFLVPRDQGLLMTACSWSSSKWAHFDDGTHAVLRVSAGRTDDTRWLSMTKSEVVSQLTDELALTVGLQGDPIVRVSEWREALPQYTPGHLERVEAIEADLAANACGVVATGAAFRGLGLPACVRQGRAAAVG